MKKRWLVFFAVAVEAIAVPEKLDPRETIARAEEVTLYSIRPSTHVKITDDHGNPTGDEAKSERIHDHLVLGKIIARDRSVRESIRAVVMLVLKQKKAEEISHEAAQVRTVEVSDFEAPLLCFEPRHAACFRVGLNHVDVLICFECGKAELRWPEFGPGDEITLKEETVGIGDEGREALNRILDDRKIERDPPAKEKRSNQTLQPAAPSGRG